MLRVESPQPTNCDGVAPAADPTGSGPSDLRALGEFLGRMAESLRPDPQRDCVEFSFSSRGSIAASIYLRQRFHTAQATALLAAMPLAEEATDILWALLSRLPAECHMARLGEGERFSLFFKTDVSVRAIRPILAALGLHDAGRPIADYFSSVARPAHGLAVEVGPAGAPRVRFYDMAADLVALDAVFDRLSESVPPPEQQAEARSLVSRLLKPGASVVVNFGADAGRGFSIKLEIPDVSFDQPPLVLTLDRDERAAYRRSCKIGRVLGQTAFSFFGWRADPQGRREITFYLDARNAPASASA